MEHRESKYIYELTNEWFAYIRNRFSKHTCINYEKVLRKFRNTTGGKYEDLTPQHIERYLQYQKRNTNNTKNTHLTAIKSFCHWCEENYDLPNPARKVKYLKREPFKQRVITPEELKKVVAVCNNNERGLVLFLANTGLRISELCDLESKNISPDGRLLHIIGKGGKQRVVPLNQTARDNLLNAVWFTNNHSRKMVWKYCVKLAKKAGIERFGPHALRHYYATQLSKSVPLHLLSKMLGHANTLITLQIYIHLYDTDFVGLTDVLDKGRKL